MHNYAAPFRGKKITVMGLGLLGRGVGDVAFLAECGAEVLVTDTKTAEQLAESVEKLKPYKNITFRLGGHVLEDFILCDMVVKAAGVPLDSPYIAAARAKGVPVVMSTALFAKYAQEAGAVIVGITGTRGKSSTTHMIFEVLRSASKKVFLGGNVRGVSTLPMLREIEAGDSAVLELDSWQLQGFGDLGISPHVAVFTNLQPDHQNYYRNGDIYFADKANIFMHQVAGDALLVGADILVRVAAAKPPVEPVVPPPIPAEWQLRIPGVHNRENASFAAAALRQFGIDEGVIKKGIESFTGVEGRLQLVREFNGVRIYNDNNATTPDATIAALHALGTGTNNIVLIMGGADKELDMGTLLIEITKQCKRVILLAGSGTDRIAPLMVDYSIYDNLEAAVREAVSSAVPGDVVLFSPAFASFGMFKNEYDRNDQVMEIIESL